MKNRMFKQAMALTTVAALSCGMLSTAVFAEETTTEAAEEVVTEEAAADRMNVLLVGEDLLDSKGQQRSDAMLLATLNRADGTISLTSFMPDLYVEVPGFGTTRLNEAYANGGVALLDQTLEQNFGVVVDGNMTVDYTSFAEAIDAIGGLDLTLTQDEAAHYAEMNADWQLAAGENHMNGEQVLILSRDLFAGADAEIRTEREREVLKAVLTAFQDKSAADQLAVVQKCFSIIKTDMELTDITEYVNEVMAIGMDNLNTYLLPVDGAFTKETVDGAEALVPDLDANQNFLREKGLID